MRLQELDDLNNNLRDLNLMNEQHSAELRRLTYLVDDLISKVNSQSYSGPGTPSMPPTNGGSIANTIVNRREPESKKPTSSETNDNIIFQSLKKLIQTVQQA